MSKVKQKQNHRRAEIILAASQLMETESFEEISVSQICEAAGISVGSFYHYFERKSDILAGLLLLADDYQKEYVLPTLVEGEEFENLLKIALGYARFVLQEGMERTALSTKVTQSDYDLTGKKRLLNRTVEEVLRRGQATGEIAEIYSVEELTAFFLTVMRGVVADWARRNNDYDLLQRMEQVIRIFLRGI